MSSQKPQDKTLIPILPVRDTVVLPDVACPLAIGRRASLAALHAARSNDGQIIVLAQKDSAKDDPEAGDLYQTGTLCTIQNILKLPDGTTKAMLVGAERVTVSAMVKQGACLAAESYSVLEERKAAAPANALQSADNLLGDLAKFPGLSQQAQGQAEDLAGRLESLLGFLAATLKNMPIDKKQALLEAKTTEDALAIAAAYVSAEVVNAEVVQAVHRRAKESIDKQQREYALRQQMAAIQKELGGDEGDDDPVAEYEKRIAALNAPEAVVKKATKELRKLKAMPPQSAESTVLRNYLDALLDYPWGKNSTINNDMRRAKDVLDEDHYGLEKVKKQVLENLAVQARLEDKGLGDEAEADILCLVGPPGVGKTSICQSLARATGREYVRMAVGGVHDEAEIRGHRRTYIGSKPGRIVEKIAQAGTENCLFVIDEIDKMGKDSRHGDPAAAMLEVLDPEQNKAFEDRYLELPIDLSRIKFVCTANDWQNIPGPLQDRMETIFLGSYTEDEKLEIARRHLLRKQRKAHGLADDELTVSDEALRDLVRYYTRESGVRTLQREIKNLCRKAVVALGEGQKAVAITGENLQDYAGKRKVSHDAAEEKAEIGVVTGLAYTSVGGETLPIEAVSTKEEGGKFIYTGSLGDVMKESIQVAEGWLKAKVSGGGIKDVTIDTIKGMTFRIHVPEGATPKDGPSAGAAMLTAIFSVATGTPVRHDVAMTGELTLRGKVTAIGGVREKLSAAARAGYKTVLIPQENVKDLDEVPQQVRDALEIVPVSTIEEVLEHALVGGIPKAFDATHVPVSAIGQPSITPH